MPINASPEYYKAQSKFSVAKTKEEKIAALEEMIRTLPKHKGVENLLASLRSKLAKLKKEPTAKKSRKQVGVKKEGEAQVCLIGFTNVGKSTLLKNITDARPEIAPYEYTTTVPSVGMMDYHGVKVQIVEIPATFSSRDLAIARTANLVVLLIRNKEETETLQQILNDHFVHTKTIIVHRLMPPSDVKQLIWNVLNLIAVYTQKTKTALALPVGATVKDCADRIHKDFAKNFRFAKIWRKERGATVMRQVGLNYVLHDGDMIEIYTS
ncbi:MAG: DUF933 domain-containing protein [Candidatus Aenigmarchaeota archaeon]|nr:DUF933 domain-containing protein [Candidatus Aenigmarchaeota archaeon]